jgi:hypothetical protein
MPLMENGGGGEHRPWELENIGPDPPTDDATVTALYRKYVDIHHSLIPYLLTVGSNAIDAGTSSMIPTVQPIVPGGITFVECLLENDCVVLDEERDGIGACLIQNQCIKADEAGNIDIGAIVNCIQRVPVVNPNPVCGEYVDLVGGLACIAACGNDVRCQATCIVDSIQFGEGLPRFRECISEGGVCASSEWSDSIMPGPDVTDWSYMLGPDMFVAPITNDGNTVEVTFPSEVKPGHGGAPNAEGPQLWIDWWDDARVFSEGSNVQYEAALDKFPGHRAASLYPHIPRKSVLAENS